MTQNSVYICWQFNGDSISIVKFGTDSLNLDSQQTGNVELIKNSILWHTVKLENLAPNTIYYYRCISNDTAKSNIYRFRTYPENGSYDNIRFVIIGDNRTYPDKFYEVMTAAKNKILELYGEEDFYNFNLVFNVGDIVTDGYSIDQYPREYFEPIREFSPYIPFMVSIGNHENESPYYYKFMKYEDFAGPEGEPYYYFNIGRCGFVSLNTNYQWRNESQLEWLDSVLYNLNNDNNIDWIFVFNHHPGHTETWYAGCTQYVQEGIIPILNKYDKVKLYSYGHSHALEFGISLESRYWLLLSGGAGGELETSGCYDFPEYYKSYIGYGYSIVDVNIRERKGYVKSYTIGNDNEKLDNVLIDSIEILLDNVSKPAAPENQDYLNLNLPYEISLGNYDSNLDLFASQIKIRWKDGNYNYPIANFYRATENYFLDFQNNLNAGVDITKLLIDTNLIVEPGTYYFKARYRNKNLEWSEWSSEYKLEIENTGFKPLVVKNKSLEFLGTSSSEAYVFIDSTSRIELPKKQMTVEMWVNVKDKDNYIAFVGNIQDNGDYEKGWYVGLYNKSFAFCLASEGADDGDGKISVIKAFNPRLDTWYHVAAVYDGNKMKIYVNGLLYRETEEQSGNILYDENSVFAIGAYIDNDEFHALNGQLDEIRIWDTALDENTIKAWMHSYITELHPYYKNLLHYWTFDNQIKYNMIYDNGNKPVTGHLMNMSIKNLDISTIPLGDIGYTLAGKDSVTLGNNGFCMKIKGTTEESEKHFWGAYQIGTFKDSLIKDDNNLPDNIYGRYNVIWGLFEYGHRIKIGDPILLDIEIDYSSLNCNEDSIAVLKRANAKDKWVDVSGTFVRDKENKKLILKGLTDFAEEYCLAFGLPSTSIKINNSADYSSKILRFYPNPANDKLNLVLQIDGDSEKYYLKFYNVLGEVINKINIHKFNEVSLDISNFNNGIYFCSLFKNDLLLDTVKFTVLK